MTNIIASFSEISDKYNAVICDLWGCLHNGVESFPEALKALEKFKASKGKVVLVTNAPRPIANVEEQIAKLGIKEIHYDMLLTSGELTSNYINNISANRLKIFHIGGKRHHSIYKDMVHERKISIEIDNIIHADLIVCTEPFDPSKDQLSDYGNTLKIGIDKDLTLLCANPDLVVDVGDKREMCAGSIASMYEGMGGKVIYFGKPHKNIYQEGKNNTILDERKLNRTIEDNKIHVDYAIKFFR